MKQKILIVLFAAFLFACKKEKGGGEPKQQSVYIAGTVQDSITQKYFPCYWKDGNLQLLERTAEDPDMEKIVVSGPDVYILGHYQQKACYWKNGNRTNLSGLPGSISVSTNDMYVAGKDMYIAGSSWDGRTIKPCYWKNGVVFPITDLVSSGSWGEAFGVYLNGSDLYLGGSSYQGAIGDIPCYWKNGVRTDLPLLALSPNDQGSVYNIISDGNNLYACGVNRSEENPGGGVHISIYNAVMWKNGVVSKLDDTPRSEALEMHITGSDVYAVGAYGEESHNVKPCYWKNGNRIILSTETLDERQRCVANSIEVSVSDIHIVGTGKKQFQDRKPTVPCYWKNGQLTILNRISENWGGSANSIFITGQ